MKTLKYFEEVYTTTNRMVRIYKILRVDETSKAWWRPRTLARSHALTLSLACSHACRAKDPANRVCDAPGSWYCVGTYPPKIQKVRSKAKNFSEVKRLARLKAGKFD